MRVTYLLDSPNLGGAEMTVLQLLEGLGDEEDQRVVAVAPASPRLLGRALRHAPVSVVPPSSIPQALAATRPHVLHVNLVDPGSNAHLLAAALARRVPVIATCHMIGNTDEGEPLARLYRSLAHVIAVSSEVEAIVRGLGVPAGRVTVVDNGVPTARRPAEGTVRDSVRIGTLARLTPQKGVDRLLEALAELVRRGRRVELVVAGEGRDAGRLQQAADGLPVRFLGFVDDVGDLLAGLDVFCLASRAEGLPLALLEAMAAGLPCVATDVGDVRRAVGEAGVVVRSGDGRELVDALDRLVLDPVSREEMGRRARRRAVERFDVARMLRSVGRIHRRAASLSGARG